MSDVLELLCARRVGPVVVLDDLSTGQRPNLDRVVSHPKCELRVGSITDPVVLGEVVRGVDVIYHLVEDDIFESYMDDLLSHSSRRLVLYTSDSDAFSPRGDPPPHIRHRPVSKWMASHPDWHMTRRIANPFPFQEFDQDNTSFADFYIFERDPGSLVSR